MVDEGTDGGVEPTGGDAVDGPTLDGDLPRRWPRRVLVGLVVAIAGAGLVSVVGLPGPSGTPLRRYPVGELDQARDDVLPRGRVELVWPTPGDPDCQFTGTDLWAAHVDHLRSRVTVHVGGNGDGGRFEAALQAHLDERGVPREMVRVERSDFDTMICGIDGA